MFEGSLTESIIKRASGKKLIGIDLIDIRNFGLGRHKIVDDKPYGGGTGMLLRVDVLKTALDSSRCSKKCREYIVLLDPKGKVYSQKKAKELSEFEHLILICPHYEGIDDRFLSYIDEQISIGDYILTGGEIPAMAIVDSVVRLIPGVLGKDESSFDESFKSSANGQLLEYPQYTRPEKFDNKAVPKVLLSGNHSDIKKWKDRKSLLLTKKNRPDLLKG